MTAMLLLTLTRISKLLQTKRWVLCSSTRDTNRSTKYCSEAASDKEGTLDKLQLVFSSGQQRELDLLKNCQ